MTKKVSVTEILKKLEIKKLKPKQKEIINLFLKKEKRDTLGILPTGYGKSLCYIVPHLLKGKNVIVISPLISLMEDQADKLKNKQINTLVFNSNHKPFKNGEVKYKDLMSGKTSYIMYFSPESFLSYGFYIKSMIESNVVSMIAIDEVHCVSMWSTFRNDYNNLYQIKDWIKKYKRNIYLLALTATATEQMLDEISEKLKLENPVIIKESLYRENLKIKVYDKTKMIDDVNTIASFIKKLGEGSKCIVYCKTRKDTESIATRLKSHKINCEHYHAGLDDEARMKVQVDYRNNKLKVISATIAWGMGIDDRNIHLIVHYGISKNIESYYQEIGRGGRDGSPVDCYVFWSKRDFSTNRYFIKQEDYGGDEAKRKMDYNKLNELEGFIKTGECRMKYICKYFGNEIEKCGKCDNCQMKSVANLEKLMNMNKNSIICRFVVIDTLRHISSGLGMSSLSMLLKGSKSKKLTPYMKSLETFGVFSGFGVDSIKKKIKNIEKCGYISEHDTRSGWGTYYKVNRDGNDWYDMNNVDIRKSIEIIKRFIKRIRKREPKNTEGIKSVATIKADLIEWRMKKVKETNLPAYCILNNKVIDSIASRQPSCEEELLEVKGIGKKLMEKYGSEILAIISK